MARVFISHRNIEEDLALARALHDELERHGHDAFLDAADLKVGDEWPAQIQRELEAADALVVLLSKRLAEAPEMVIEELAIARDLRRQSGRPKLLPICLGEDVIPFLPYDLAAMVKRTQFAQWTGPADGTRVVKEILGGLEAGDGASPSRGLPDPRSADEASRPAALDLGPTRDAPARGAPARSTPARAALSDGDIPPPQPPRTPYNSYWYMPRTDAERQAEGFLREPGSPVVLVGPSELGKTYLLDHLLAVHCGAEDCAVRINLDFLDPETLASDDELFRELGFEILEALDLDDDALDRAWERKKRRSAGAKLRYFLEKSALPKVAGRLFLAFDRTDAVAENEAARSLLREMRRWSELGGRDDTWARLRLLLAISTEPGRLLDTLESSPFNISPPIRLVELEPEDLRDLAGRYGLLLEDGELDRMVDLVGGHPTLTRRIFYEAASKQVRVAELITDCATARNLLEDHLHSRRLKVQTNPELTSALRQVLDGDTGDIHPDNAHQLLSCGLLAGEPGAYRMRYRIYETYFRDWLPR